MAELRTLRNLNLHEDCVVGYMCECTADAEGILRAEAVKWIKQIYYVGTDDKNSEENIKHADAVKVWIKHFFNITDAELE